MRRAQVSEIHASLSGSLIVWLPPANSLLCVPPFAMRTRHQIRRDGSHHDAHPHDPQVQSNRRPHEVSRGAGRIEAGPQTEGFESGHCSDTGPRRRSLGFHPTLMPLLGVLHAVVAIYHCGKKTLLALLLASEDRVQRAKGHTSQSAARRCLGTAITTMADARPYEDSLRSPDSNLENREAVD